MTFEYPTNFYGVLFWINIGAGIPLTLLAICSLCCQPRKDQLPITYVANLLISNLIQICSTILWEINLTGMAGFVISMIISTFGLCYGVLTSLCFRMCVALERYMVIAFPKQNCIRRAGTSVFVCVTIWVLCFIIIFFAMRSKQYFYLPYPALLPFPLFIACLVLTLGALPAATSVPAGEKRRTVGALVLLLVNYTLLILPSIIMIIVMLTDATDFPGVVLPLIQLSAFPDLILVVFMREGPVDKLLARLCCCRMDDVAADDCGKSQV
ncbi:proteinase-activated receptor 2-like [Seriola aureovittata]|uniref:proteinase-activated receptor 2-like n=1 Tax=Seriola aureovittata TaxID=2871759 RepID=UPI0024BE23CF|nr:proteinase-activated receptor 2-like [Seriola aureovittata]